MILIDDRAGSSDLVQPLIRAGYPVEVVRMDYGDVAFVGKGPKNTELHIGIEFKTMGDLVSSVRTGRLAGHQLQGLRDTYDYAWLLIEGSWRADEVGRILTRKPGRGWRPLRGGMNANELEKHVHTLHLCGGLIPRFTDSRADSVRFVGTLYRWWTDTSLDRHTSHIAVHTPPTLVPLSPFRQAACMWPGIGVKTSRAVEQRFGGSILRAASGTVRDWADITITDSAGKSKRLGETVAQRIVTFMKGTA